MLLLDAICNTDIAWFVEDDKTNNLKSTNRKLDRKLTLLVKQKIGERELWVMPQGELEDGESLRQVSSVTMCYVG